MWDLRQAHERKLSTSLAMVELDFFGKERFRAGFKASPKAGKIRRKNRLRKIALC